MKSSTIGCLAMALLWALGDYAALAIAALAIVAIAIWYFTKPKPVVRNPPQPEGRLVQFYAKPKRRKESV